MAIPEGCYGRIAPRSGLAVKKGINTGAGVVDYDYRGEVGVVLFNHGTEDFAVAPGDRVAQLILVQHAVQLVPSLRHAVSVVGVHDEDQTLGVLEVVPPKRANLCATSRRKEARRSGRRAERRCFGNF